MTRQTKVRPRKEGVGRKLILVGGVLMVSIPAIYAKDLGWQAGDEVRVELRGKEIRVWKPVITHPGR